MTALGLPYLQTPTWSIDLPGLGSHTITVFGPLAALGIAVGYRLAMRFARARKLDVQHMDGLLVRVVVVGLAVAHWVSMLLYYPDRVADNPWLLLPFGSGLSSVGGFIGGTVAFSVYVRRRRLPSRAYADAVAFGLLAGFTIGRLGCSLVHDHPGAIASAGHWLAVGPWPDGAHRYDLGLIELCGLLTLCAFVYLAFGWRAAPPGRLTAVLAVTYGVGRFPLDLLRAVDQRYLGLTPAQYACIAFIVGGVALYLTEPRVKHSSDP